EGGSRLNGAGATVVGITTQESAARYEADNATELVPLSPMQRSHQARNDRQACRNLDLGVIPQLATDPPRETRRKARREAGLRWAILHRLAAAIMRPLGVTKPAAP